MSRDKRLKRFALFNEFYTTTSKVFFAEFSGNDEQAQELDREFSFYVTPGGHAGGNNPKIVEIHFGKRMLRSNKTRNGFTSDTEAGGALIYESLDNGYIVVTMYPASTQNIKRKEDGIVLTSNMNPRFLKSKSILRKHWRSFIAYMEVSSIDGMPSPFQILRIRRLLITHPVIKNGIAQGTKRKAALKWIINFLLFTGCSGFVYAIYSEFKNTDKNEPTSAVESKSNHDTLAPYHQKKDTLVQ